jgi:hypothetical protein
MDVTNKHLMYALLQGGRFGNAMQVWSSVDEVLASGYVGLVSIRSREVSHPVRLYHVPTCELREVVAGLGNRAAGSLTFCESPADELRLINGELCDGSLFYSQAKLPMRFALERDGCQVHGLRAKMLLRSCLTPGDYEWLEALQEDFPGHVIEFTGFSRRVGNLRRQMCVWEVRKY